MRRHTPVALTFSDLFAGIGGIRLAFEGVGCSCVFSSEIDRRAQDTYEAFFGERPDFSLQGRWDLDGDITKLPTRLVPPHNILTGGFPCQPFSLAGVSKKNALGRKHGFDDLTQGTLFFDIVRVLRAKKPLAFLLENVKNLQSHDGGRTFSIIMDALHAIGYDRECRVIDSRYWVPQHRERLYIVGFNRRLNLRDRIAEVFPGIESRPKVSLDRILQSPEEIERLHGDRYMLGPGTWATLLRHKAHHLEAGNGFGYGLIEPPFDGKVTRTLSARYHKDGAEILIAQPCKPRPRRLTPLECLRLQGFPMRLEKYFNGTRPQPVSDTQAYRQFGNSVTVPVVTKIAQGLVRVLSAQMGRKET